MKEKDRVEKEETDQQKRMYRETLNNQAAMNELNRNNYGKMTFQEKKLNRADLRGYKNKDRRGPKAMIPGISNLPGVGSGPLGRGAVRMMEYADDVGVPVDKKKGQVFFSP